MFEEPICHLLREQLLFKIQACCFCRSKDIFRLGLTEMHIVNLSNRLSIEHKVFSKPIWSMEIDNQR